MRFFNGFWKQRLVFLYLVLTIVPVTFSSCRHASTNAPSRDARHAQLDSIIGKIQDLDSLESLVRQSHEQNDAVGEMLALKHKGIRLHNQALYPQAIKAHAAGLDIATRLVDTVEMAMAHCNLGADYRRMSNMGTAMSHYIKALKLYDAFSDRDCKDMLKVRASTLNGIGNVETEFGNYTVADSVLHLALQAEQQLGNTQSIALNYGHLGNLKRAINENDSALFYYNKSLEYNQIAGSQQGVAMCHLHFGELYEDNRRFSHAVEEYKQAYDQLKGRSAVWHWLASCLALTRVNILLGEEQEAHNYLTEAEAEALRTGCKKYQAEASMLHYELSLLCGNQQKALGYYIRGTELMDSIYGMQQVDEMNAQRMDYERSLRSGELEGLNRDLTKMKHRQTMQWLFIILLLLMAAAVIGTLVYAMRVRSRTQRLMRQVEETRSLFFTNVVHQLRSPLSAIMGAIDGITVKDEQGHDAVRSENAEIIKRQGENLLMLVDRILQVGSVRSALRDPEWRSGDLVAFVRMMVESYREQCVERQIELTYAPRENDAEVEIVPSYLKTIIGSLIENAIAYSREYGKIVITTKVDGDKYTIRVADDGMGIDKVDLPHVFEPFYRASAAEQIVDGIGIGLTVVRDMTMALGGTVGVDSEGGKGAVFTVTLPCRHVGDVKQRLELKVEPLRQVPKRLSRRYTVDNGQQDCLNGRPVALVVEDHSDVAHIIGQALGQDYAVHYAADGETGLARAEDLLPDIIITDVKMPVVDGLELCRRIRRSARLCHVPIIVLSARTGEMDRVRGIKAGADVYLVKPFVKEELLAWAERLIESRKLLRDELQRCLEPNRQAVAGDAACEQDDVMFLADFAAEVDKQSSSGMKLDLEKIAIKLKMGETQMRRRIQTITGKNVPAYVTQLRMEKAMRLLRDNPDCLIGDVADKCGFQDVAYFSRVFRQHYGMAPSQMRDSVK